MMIAQNGDVGISGSFGSLSFSAVADTDDPARRLTPSLCLARADAFTWSVVSTDSHEMTAGTAGVTAVASKIITNVDGVVTTVDPTGAAVATQVASRHSKLVWKL